MFNKHISDPIVFTVNVKPDRKIRESKQRI